MGNCNTIILDYSQFLLTWDGIDLTDGLSKESSNISIEFSADDVEVTTSATGKYSVRSVSNDTSGSVTLNLLTGSKAYTTMVSIAFSNFAREGTMTISNLLTSETYTLECAGMMKRPARDFGVNGDASADVDFTFASWSEYNEPTVHQGNQS